ESFNEQTFKALTGMDVHFVQDNESQSTKGVLRGLHYQVGDFAQAKLVRVTQGAVWDVAVDIRPGSKTFGQHFGTLLSAELKNQLFIPRGFAHGFLVLTDTAVFSYKCDNFYHKDSEAGIIWNDSDLQIDWYDVPETFIISEKDKNQ
ncbi:dTDP-4-dehydrorhamnose 3,5-epimerase, partial [Arthrospira platensis SPKY1]|nr:dTDP-4-dehydrorhamnose 3,5-epimerase [Arthrospira platensis SPKY1]